jgi:hypothetical protein
MRLQTFSRQDIDPQWFIGKNKSGKGLAEWLGCNWAALNHLMSAGAHDG